MDVTGDYPESFRSLLWGIEAEIGLDLPINATSPIAVLTAEMALPPTAAGSIAIVSCDTRVVPEVLEELEPRSSAKCGRTPTKIGGPNKRGRTERH